MRLIDADALKTERGMADRCEDCKHDARMCQYNQDYTRMDICGMLDDAPTIDAIPTDWLRAKMKEYENREFDEPGMYFRFVLWAWQKHCDEVNETEVKPKRLKDQVCGNDYCELR